jgi:flagellar hook-associated protein 1 FlgK
MSGFGLLNLGTQSLQANQTALSVTGQNISNVNTDGYSRQRPVFQAREELGGVKIDDIDRIADAFLNRQIWADSASYNSYDEYKEYANELDNLMASNITSISTAMDDYFGALQTAVDDPVSLPNRELFIAQSDALVKRFNDLDANIRRQNDTINGRLESNVSVINTIATHIATLNDDIRISEAAGGASSELLDQRDAKLEELSEYISFTTLDQGTGEVSVFIGNGEPLVVGLSANSLTTIASPADTSQLNVALQIGSNVADITNQVSGGKVGGLLDYRENILNNTLDELGRMALVFADTMNEQHVKGIDLDGNAGGLMFQDINSGAASASRVLSERDNTSSISASVTINDVQALQAAEYELIFNDHDTFTLIRGDHETVWSSDTLTPATIATDVDQDGEYFFNQSTGELRIQIDGFTLNMDATPSFSTGDKYLIHPTRNGAAELTSILNNARQLALASPLTVSESVSNTGTGTATVSITDNEYDALSAVPTTTTPPAVAGLVVNADDSNGGGVSIEVTDDTRVNNLEYPLTLIYNSGGNSYTINDLNGAVGTSPYAPDGSGVIDLTAEFGLSFTMDGGPIDGEVTQIAYDATSIPDSSLTPPLNVSFLPALEGVANTGNKVVTVPVSLSGTDAGTPVTGINFSSSTVSFTDAELASKPAYPLTFTYDDSTGNFDITDANNDSWGAVPAGATMDMTLQLGLSITGLTMPMGAIGDGATFTIQPDDANQVQYSPVFSPVTTPSGGILEGRVTDPVLARGAEYPLSVTYESLNNYVVTDSAGNSLYTGPLNTNNLPLASIGLNVFVSNIPNVGEVVSIQPDVNSNDNSAAAVTNIRITDDRLVGAVTYPLTVIYDTATTPGEFTVSDGQAPAEVLFRGPWNDGTLDLTNTYGFAIDMNSDEEPEDGDTFIIQHDASSDAAEFVVLRDADGDRVLKEYTPGQAIQLSGYEVTISNQPKVGDRFTVNPNIDGVSDNRNALLMSDLQFAKIVEGASYQDKYGQTVERVGTQAAVAQVNASAGKAVLDANIEKRDSISGVNLDEEAAKLVQFQQAYQASAQLIRAAQTIFDSLLQSL